MVGCLLLFLQVGDWQYWSSRRTVAVGLAVRPGELEMSDLSRAVFYLFLCVFIVLHVCFGHIVE